MKHAALPCLLTGMTAIALTSASASAQSGDWSFEITPYAWFAGIEGQAEVLGNTVEFDKSATDMFDALETAASLRLGARRDRFIMGAQIDYVALETSELDVLNSLLSGRFKSDMLIAEFAAGYVFDGWMEGQTIGVMAGIRHLSMDTDLTVGAIPFSQDVSCTDAMIYLVPSMPVLPSKIQGLRFNPVMGFGTGDSEFAFELYPQFQYQMTDTVALRFGYRNVGWKFDKRDTDVRLSGFTFGVGVTF
ncbi:MAG TPA: hypothetical protein VFY13_02660 [Luteolibacter sp.]|nr:hypothetical protein [Luteolibacter sp.]